MHGEAFRCVCELIVLTPAVGDGPAKRNHALEYGKLPLQRRFRFVRKLCGLRAQCLDEVISLLSHQLDAVRGQELIVAERGRDRLRSRFRLLEARLHVVCAVAARLEGVNTYDLLLGQPGGKGDFGISAFILDLTSWLLRNKTEFLRRSANTRRHYP